MRFGIEANPPFAWLGLCLVVPPLIETGVLRSWRCHSLPLDWKSAELAKARERGHRLIRIPTRATVGHVTVAQFNQSRAGNLSRQRTRSVLPPLCFISSLRFGSVGEVQQKA